jgi:hypothetical protein
MSTDPEQKSNNSKAAIINSGSDLDCNLEVNDTSPAIKEKRAIFNKILADVDEKLANTSSRCYLVVNTIKRINIEALFTNNEAAEKYINRIAINFSVDLYCEQCKDAQSQPSEAGFMTFVRQMISDNYKIIHVNHLDLSKKVYKVQSRNYICYEEPTSFLKNSEEEWKTANTSRMGTYAYSENKDWLEHCTVKINPPLPELQCNYY